MVKPQMVELNTLPLIEALAAVLGAFEEARHCKACGADKCVWCQQADQVLADLDFLCWLLRSLRDDWT
ncbi:MAG: hypothetical protein ACYC4B_19520 [Pirellulaceae bacterium]